MATKNTTKTQTTVKSRQQQRELGRLLEMDANEMSAEVLNELERNPALEKVEDDDGLNTRTEDGRVSETSDQIQRNDYYDPDDIPPPFLPRTYHQSGDGERNYVPDVVSEESLADYLMAQVRESDLPEADISIAKTIIGNIDSNGWLPRSSQLIADDITFNEGLDTMAEDVERVRAFIQQLDPPGVAASTLKECMLLQLKRKTGEDAQMAYRIIDQLFELFSKKRYDAIAAALHTDVRTVDRIIKQEIQTLNPKPGSAFSGGRGESHRLQITPDFNVEIEDDTLTLSLNNKIPELCISESYQMQKEMYENTPPVTANQKNQKRIVTADYDRAKNYLELLKMRQVTLFSCMREICRRQKEFFFTGDVVDLKPMTLQNIADAVGRDVSVISRAMANKYVDTQWGVKSLKFFFSEGIDGVSTTEIKEALKMMIEKEDKCKPYTDKALESMLNERNYNISRRTVTKYRKQLGIPTANHRRQVH